MSIVVGLDLGSRLGFAKSNGEYGAIELLGKGLIETRQYLYKTCLPELILGIENLDYVVYEKITYESRNWRDTQAAGVNNFIIEMFCEENQILCVPITVQDWKKRVFKHGRINKAAIKKELAKVGLHHKHQDALDAIAILCGYTGMTLQEYKNVVLSN